MQSMSSLFSEKTLVFLCVVLALVLLAAAAVAIVRALGDRAGRALGGRGRQQRLGVVDAFDLDRQRQLVIIRRDNIEHLLMIGGPNDVLVESAIVRQTAANAPLLQRETAPYPVASPSSAAAARQAAEERGEFDPPTREPSLPVSAAFTPAHAPEPVASPPAPPPPAASRLPFPPRPAPAPPRQPPAVREAAKPLPSPPPAYAAPERASNAGAPPPAAPSTPAGPPTLELVPLENPDARGAEPRPTGAPPVPAPAPRTPARAPLAKPSRPFPTLRPGGGPLFPVRSATPQVVKPSEGAAPPPAAPTEQAGPSRQAQIESFESLEEEMAKLLGRQNSAEN